jgi:hypothetical protein
MPPTLAWLQRVSLERREGKHFVNVYLLEKPVLCLRVLSLKHVNNRGPLSPFFDASVYLPEKLVLCLRKLSLKHVNTRGPPSPFFNLSVYLQEEVVLCLRRLSLMEVRIQGATNANF